MDGNPITILGHKSCEGDHAPEVYQYRECGLDNVWLVGGVSIRLVQGEKCLNVQDCDELHEAIALSIIHKPDRITGQEFRFLRHELGLTQTDVGRLLEADVQSVARWEKGKAKAPGPADRLIRFLYIRKHEKNRDVMEFLEELAALDRMTCGKQLFQRTHTGWKAARSA